MKPFLHSVRQKISDYTMGWTHFWRGIHILSFCNMNVSCLLQSKLCFYLQLCSPRLISIFCCFCDQLILSDKVKCKHMKRKGYYCKPLRYAHLSCVIFDDMHFWIVSENTWDMQFLVFYLEVRHFWGRHFSLKLGSI